MIPLKGKKTVAYTPPLKHRRVRLCFNGIKCADYKKRETPRRQRFRGENGVRGSTKTMSIVLFLGSDIKEYEEKSAEIIEHAINKGTIQCELCLRPMAVHSSYERGIKETGERIEITMVWCKKCRNWHALLPDFLLPHKHYSGNEVEIVIIDGATMPVSEIDTAASESTVRRWLKQVGERIVQAVGKLKYHFGRDSRAVNEVAIVAGYCFNELEQVLEMAPAVVKCSKNKLGLANIWLGTCGVTAYI